MSRFLKTSRSKDRLYEDARAARRAARASQGTLAKQEDVPTHLPDQVAAFEAMPLFLAHVPPQYFEISGVMKPGSDLLLRYQDLHSDPSGPTFANVG